MLNLYQIQNEYRQITAELIELGGELTAEIEAALAINEQQLQEKAVNFAYAIKQADAEVDVIEAEIKRLQDLKARRTKAIERLKKTITDAMELYGITELKGETIKLSLRKSESVEVFDDVDINYCNEVTKAVPDKARIKEAIRSGQAVAGAAIVERNNLQIK